MSMPFEVFFSYAPEDQDWLKKIAKYLYTLQRQKYIQGWHDLNILAGSEWESEIITRLNSAPIILLLVSQDFIASDFCWGVQLQQAMQRHNAGTARVIPIIVRPTDWHDTPFATLHFLPEDGKPLSTHPNEDEALLQVAQGIRRVVEQMRKQPQTTIATKRAARTITSPTQQSWNVPLLRNPFFTGRESLLNRLRTSLIETHTMALSQPQAISGLGGVGKTQIALEYAYRYRNDYQAVLWVKASTREELSEDVAALTRTLNLPEQRASKQQESIDTIKRWLATHIGWLLIFDNADDLSPLSDYLPPEPKGHILLTTRAHAMGGMAQKLEVAHMDEAEGIHLLLHRAGLIDQQTAIEHLPAQIYQQAAVIFHLLGGLPLALDQAGAYIEETHESLYSYANLYQTQRKDLLERRGGIRSDHLPVATTWNLALQTIEQTNPAAIELIRLCAFLAPDAIPEEMILAGEEDLSPLLQTITHDRPLWNSALADLLKYSLIQRNQVTMSLSIHRLLQAVIRDELDAQQQEAWEICVVRMMYYVFPFDSNEYDDDESESEDKNEQDKGKDRNDDESNNNAEENEEYEGPPWKQGQEYLPHALLATEYVAQRTMTFPEAIGLLDDVGSYLYEQGQYLQAEPLLQRSLTVHEEVFGPDHPDITRSLTNLANLYQTQSKYEQAERLFQRTLTIKERLLGPDHPDIATALHNLAILYAIQDKFDKAEPLFLRALTIREHVLGPDHLATASILTNLAILYTDQYKLRQAKSLHRRSLTIHERVLGPDHPDTAKALHSFAGLYRDDGRYRRAQQLYQRVLAIQERALGPKHPDIVATLENLADLYKRRGKYKLAEQFYQRALTTCEHTHGPEHPHTARILNNFAGFYHHLYKRNYEQAKLFYQRSLAIREHVFGPDHPETAHGLYVLAGNYADQGKYEQAEPLYKRALTIQEHILGPNHRDTVKVRKDYQKLLRKKEGQRGGLFSFFFKKRR